ncbi:hypothetical protein A9P82_05300 [Arachidicoccus ginsenosidimutans]|nr:hypothetical protein A9P82_05300 [Arachidicoccus sp. BS20]
MFLDNTIKAWFICAGAILLALIFSRFISKGLATLFVKLFTKVKHTDYSDVFKKNIVKPLSHYIFWSVVVFSLEKLSFPHQMEFDFFKTKFSKVLDAISMGWLTVCFFQLVIGIAMFIAFVLKESAAKKNDRPILQMISLLADLVRAVLIVFCILFVLKVSFNYSLSSFVTSLGLVTAALALAAKESVENIICSFVIFLDKPFFVGDTINVNGVSGTVEKIGLRSTLLRTDAKTLVNMSNSSVIGGTLENKSNQTYRHTVQTLELDLDTTPETIQELVNHIKKLLQNMSNESIVNPAVYFKDTGINSHKIFVEYFGLMNMTYADFTQRVQQINIEIVTIIKQLNISLVKLNDR